MTSAFRRPWAAGILLTLGLGATVAVSWLVFGGSVAFRGPVRVIEELWPLIYGSQALLAAAGTYWLAGRAALMTTRHLIGLVIAAWVGEWLVLLVGGRLFANELVPDVSWFFWLIGTGGPIQPVAAVVGGLVALRRKERGAT
jgi:uncharacterized membrane protein